MVVIADGSLKDLRIIREQGRLGNRCLDNLKPAQSAAFWLRGLLFYKDMIMKSQQDY